MKFRQLPIKNVVKISTGDDVKECTLVQGSVVRKIDLSEPEVDVSLKDFHVGTIKVKVADTDPLFIAKRRPFSVAPKVTKRGDNVVINLRPKGQSLTVLRSLRLDFISDGGKVIFSRTNVNKSYRGQAIKVKELQGFDGAGKLIVKSITAEGEHYRTEVKVSL